MPDTVLVAAPEYLPALQEQGDFGDALAFSDADALKALEAITRDRPKVIALEKQFAATSRGAALIKRIKADPKLRKCEIRVVSLEGDSEEFSAQPTRRYGGGPRRRRSSSISEARDARNARKIVDGVEVLIDGSPAMLIDLSVVGAQVVSPTILRPNQRVRMILPDEERPIRCVAGVAWAAFEMPKSGPRYRAGIEFFDAESGNLDRFIEQNKLS